MKRKNKNCPDGWEHKMPDGKWMCGKYHKGKIYRHIIQSKKKSKQNKENG